MSSRLLNAAQRDPRAVKPWALSVLADLVVPDDSIEAGISAPTSEEASTLAARIDALPVPPQSDRWTQARRNEENAENSVIMARAILAVIPRTPVYVNYAEVVDALADAAGSMAEFAEQRQLRTQLIDAAKETGDDVREAWEEVERVATRPALSLSAGLLVGLLVALYVVAKA
jgi:hypothetical protein